jgi:hypothetical protein
MMASPGIRGRQALAIAFSIAVVLAVVAASPVAAQQTFLVTTTADTVDAIAGDGVCADAGGAWQHAGRNTPRSS